MGTRKYGKKVFLDNFNFEKSKSFTIVFVGNGKFQNLKT